MKAEAVLSRDILHVLKVNINTINSWLVKVWHANIGPMALWPAEVTLAQRWHATMA